MHVAGFAPSFLCFFFKKKKKRKRQHKLEPVCFTAFMALGIRRMFLRRCTINSYLGIHIHALSRCCYYLDYGVIQ